MATAQAFRTLRHAFHRVADQTVDFALVPVENSQAGSVLETYDLLLEYRALVVAEMALQVDHCLLVVPGAQRAQLKRVLSHPQALAQCEAFIVREGLEPIPVYDTAGGAARHHLSPGARHLRACASAVGSAKTPQPKAAITGRAVNGKGGHAGRPHASNRLSYGALFP